MDCPYCGANNRDRAKFCRSCARRIDQVESNGAESDSIESDSVESAGVESTGVESIGVESPKEGFVLKTGSGGAKKVVFGVVIAAGLGVGAWFLFGGTGQKSEPVDLSGTGAPSLPAGKSAPPPILEAKAPDAGIPALPPLDAKAPGTAVSAPPPVLDTKAPVTTGSAPPPALDTKAPPTTVSAPPPVLDTQAPVPSGSAPPPALDAKAPTKTGSAVPPVLDVPAPEAKASKRATPDTKTPKAAEAAKPAASSGSVEKKAPAKQAKPVQDQNNRTAQQREQARKKKVTEPPKQTIALKQTAVLGALPPPRATPAAPPKTGMAAEMESCATKSFVAKVLCENQVRAKFCPGKWGTIPECPKQSDGADSGR